MPDVEMGRVGSGAAEQRESHGGAILPGRTALVSAAAG
jgi:hypothetical protein